MNDFLPPRRQATPGKQTLPRQPQAGPQASRPLDELPPVQPQALPLSPAPVRPTFTAPTTQHLAPEAPVAHESPQQTNDLRKPRRRKRGWPWWLGGGILVVIILAAGIFFFYRHELSPVSPTAQTTTRLTVVADSSPRQIGQLLFDKQLIRSTTVFDIYTRFSGSGGKFQAGTYNLSAAMSLPTIIDHLASGKTDSMRITFLPGVSLRPNPSTPVDQRTDIESVLLRVGFEKNDIEAAFTKQYDHKLLEGRPAGADIEGYVYGETYDFNSNASLDDIFNHVFDTYYAALQKDGVPDALKAENLSLYQGVTLASIVQREVSSSDPSTASHDQQQVSQVFRARLARGMPLGSDVTAYYGAIKAGQTPAVTVDTPYNTRIHTGLPPGPIATPSMGALEAVSHPAQGDYLFFLSGDDNVMYYAHTDAEHQANIKAHCKVKCAVS